MVRKESGDKITAAARAAATANGWSAQTPNQVCDRIEQLIQFAAVAIAQKLNEEQILGGNFNGHGRHTWDKYKVRHIFRTYRGVTLTKFRRLRKLPTQGTSSAKKAPRKKAAKAKTNWRTQPTARALRFVKDHPEWTIWPQTEIVALYDKQLHRGMETNETVAQLNKDKILRPNYQNGGPEWTSNMLTNMWRAVHGRPISGQKRKRKRKAAKKTTKATPIAENAAEKHQPPVAGAAPQLNLPNHIDYVHEFEVNDGVVSAQVTCGIFQVKVKLSTPLGEEICRKYIQQLKAKAPFDPEGWAEGD